MKHIHNDGGRALAGFKGSAGDCVTRSIAIVSGLPYQQVYDTLAQGNGTMRAPKRRKAPGRSARNGVYTKRKWFKDQMRAWGFTWTPTMRVGQGCKVHLRADELPTGRLVVAVSKHYTAVIDGVIHDTHDPQRLAFGESSDAEDISGTRCVYGYWKFN